MRALVEQVLVHLLRNYSQPRLPISSNFLASDWWTVASVARLKLMHTQLDQTLSLNALAAALSPHRFIRTIVQEAHRLHTARYLAGIRAKRAQLLLAGTDLSVTKVGAQVGYLSASHFTKAFRIATGTTPREFSQRLLISPSNNNAASRRQ